MYPTFEPAGELPQGTWAIEASAGTGKTYAIAALVVRYLAEGIVTPENLAVITFNRSAAGELNGRIRQRVRSSLRKLQAAANGGHCGQLDETDELLQKADSPELNRRIDRLSRSLANLESASVTTIHGFCEEMLAELGIWAIQDPKAVLVEDLSRLRGELIRDEYLRRYTNTSPPFSLEIADSISKEALAQQDAQLVPADSEGVSSGRVSFAKAIRARMADYKRRLGVYSFADQLSRLHDSVCGPVSTVVRQRLRMRYQVVLVDEFQDTDRVQWEILRTCFHGHSTLILIGDPKQAIYNFRGADVTTYLNAVKVADERRSLLINYRGDEPLVKAIGTLFENTLLGPEISVPPVSAHQKIPRLKGHQAPVRLRCISQDTPLKADEARAKIAADLVALTAELLAHAELFENGKWRALQGDDIAVLVRSNDSGRNIANELTKAGLPVAFQGVDSVFSSQAAQSWLTLLQALIQPTRANLKRILFTDFFGASLAEVAAADEAQLSKWSSQRAAWAQLLANSSVAALFAAIQTDTDFVRSLLTTRMGERKLTDYRHIAQLLHAQQSVGISGLALLSWLENQLDLGQAAHEATRRLETDRHAIQVMTIHRAKGLQFPVVLLPQAADQYVSSKDQGNPLTLLGGQQGERILDVGGKSGPGRSERFAAMAIESADDDLRTLYVAMTRAQSHLIAWWARTGHNTAGSGLHRLLFRNLERNETPHQSYPIDTPPGDGHPSELKWLNTAEILVEDCTQHPTVGKLISPGPAPSLELAKFNRSIDKQWMRTSYSGLTADVHNSLDYSSVPDEPEDNESADLELASDQTSDSNLVQSPMASFVGGTWFGTIVHEIFETLDWNTDDDAELLKRIAAACAKPLRRSPLSGITADGLATGLLPALRTGLGPLTNGISLSEIAVTNRLSELDFELPLGNFSGSRVDAENPRFSARTITTLGAVTKALKRWLPATDPLAAYAEHLEDPLLAGKALYGFLVGSIDSVLRITCDHQTRFVVVDYKTNRIGTSDPLTVQEYTRAAMAKEMIRSHYPLQALLYCVALHRFLTARLAGYSPQKHLGGVGYLFVRGMSGPNPVLDQDRPTGVFDWYPPTGLVVELSELLAGKSI